MSHQAGDSGKEVALRVMSLSQSGVGRVGMKKA
jgi:hypothetical protein